MSLRTLKLFTVLVPVFIIGGFEYVRHEFLLYYLTMEAGNFVITIITLVLSYWFATWMFEKIKRINDRLTEGEARRAVYEERERLARELHDDLAQTLFFLNVKLKQGELEEAKAAVSEIDNSLRQAIFNLRTPPEDGVAFASRLNKWLQDWQAASGIAVATQIEVTPDAFRAAEEVQLFGIVQEAFTNIRKHSRARHATILLTAAPGSWRLRIADDGCGLGEPGSARKTYGTELMSKRAAELGATLAIGQAPDGESGTVVSAAYPAAAAHQTAEGSKRA
ncbi:sensor histidine kinase [Paenibacillus athensensis]|uniref:histidine kinase n=1 Tax=Paenibacillus athensensis TaxID=1967502 RepID=A0A4Y8Q0C2_9BACL|nr:histidine kinase [Paenibacillus athensensis]MCD1259347.1 sensor histidine kinase [Paenibacillus athensensis]